MDVCVLGLLVYIGLETVLCFVLFLQTIFSDAQKVSMRFFFSVQWEYMTWWWYTWGMVFRVGSGKSCEKKHVEMVNSRLRSTQSRFHSIDFSAVFQHRVVSRNTGQRTGVNYMMKICYEFLMKRRIWNHRISLKLRKRRLPRSKGKTSWTWRTTKKIAIAKSIRNLIPIPDSTNWEQSR